MNCPFTSSLKDTLPRIGLELQTNINFKHQRDFYRFTTSTTQKYCQCKQCGVFFIHSKYEKNRYFCSNSCSAKYRMLQYLESRRKLIYKNLNHTKFNIFYQKYNSYVTNLFHKYEAEYMEDLIEWWQDYAIICFSNISKLEKNKKGQIARFAYLKQCIHLAYLGIVKRRKKEVFYDECSIGIQQKILGTYNERN